LLSGLIATDLPDMETDGKEGCLCLSGAGKTTEDVIGLFEISGPLEGNEAEKGLVKGHSCAIVCEGSSFKRCDEIPAQVGGNVESMGQFVAHEIFVEMWLS